MLGHESSEVLEPAPREAVGPPSPEVSKIQCLEQLGLGFKTDIAIHKVGLNYLQMTFQSKFFYDSVIPISYVNTSLISEKQQGTFIWMGLQDVPPVR